jgi:uncharacterized protein
MSLRTDTFDLGGLRLHSGEGRRLELSVAIDRFALADESYAVALPLVAVVLDVSRTTAEGYVLRLRFTAQLEGPCMRCLEPASRLFEVDSREVSQPGESDELRSPYVEGGVLDLRAWARDALALAMPTQILCRAECAGLCPICGIDLNTADPGHAHEREPDSRWGKLSELRFD